jgi:hypothetical protein
MKAIWKIHTYGVGDIEFWVVFVIENLIQFLNGFARKT